MGIPKTVKILKFHPERCNGCLECEKALELVEVKIEDIKEVVYHKQGA